MADASSDNGGRTTPSTAATPCDLEGESLSCRKTAKRPLPDDAAGAEGEEHRNGFDDDENGGKAGQDTSAAVEVPEKSMEELKRMFFTVDDVISEYDSAESVTSLPADDDNWDRVTDGFRLVHLLVDPPCRLAEFFENTSKQIYSRSAAAMLGCRSEHCEEAFSMFRDVAWKPSLLIKDDFLDDLNATPSVANQRVTLEMLRSRLVEFKALVSDVDMENRGSLKDQLWERCMIHRKPPRPDVYYFLRLVDAEKIPNSVIDVMCAPWCETEQKEVEDDEAATSIYVPPLRTKCKKQKTGKQDSSAQLADEKLEYLLQRAENVVLGFLDFMKNL
ncbi:hypothetical protein GUITHDRAFT_115796 [Guillardia theta CCMP2712]|uniref:Uncharacterized protein n=1 Tax=Guillardia theta (strain CCMP2712) TaxID=905079 RepID=L1IQ73_GUITC|nr:hypothetical protein GUITHDRAFT_115796 [Guillardia theta CCMP2712]EKX38034.1 hypothetical protein GUITHDRAFT_115796 [Guillardia theta CCMP2712]|eukprot:XP_005825014.1 hypothetical protein GUITHDRAFT_115796 [Guillardia theta CCMP2712]